MLPLEGRVARPSAPPYHRSRQFRPEEARMEKRRSIEVPGVKHVNPIPAACRRGPFVTTGAISGADPATGKVPEDLDAQCRQMFENVRRLITAAGGTPED